MEGFLIFLGLGAIGSIFGLFLGWLIVKNTERQIKKLVERCKKEWKGKNGARLKEVYVTEESYIENEVERALGEMLLTGEDR